MLSIAVPSPDPGSKVSSRRKPAPIAAPAMASSRTTQERGGTRREGAASPLSACDAAASLAKDGRNGIGRERPAGGAITGTAVTATVEAPATRTLGISSAVASALHPAAATIPTAMIRRRMGREDTLLLSPTRAGWRILSRL